MGASKALIELAEEMRALGWECDLLSPFDLHPEGSRNGEYSEHLRRHLRRHADEYDVVDYDHNHLPYPRGEFSESTLFVARSVLLTRHLDRIKIPSSKRLKSRIGHLVRGRRFEARQRADRRRADVTVHAADLVNVLNYDDRAELVSFGVPAEKIVVIPVGMSRARRPLFDAVSSAPPAEPKVAFVGTFDNRKGAADFPRIVSEVCAAVPGVKFRLLCTFRGEADVLASFPKRLRSEVEVIPLCSPEKLHEMLAPCSIGVFPSYLEGFPFAVLEMLAASIPVIAYDSPGPPMMLPPEHLVTPGDTRAMSGKVIELLKDKARLAAARARARESSRPFCWQSIARQTSDVYAERLRLKTTRGLTGQIQITKTQCSQPPPRYGEQ